MGREIIKEMVVRAGRVERGIAGGRAYACHGTRVSASM
jgi:hypothetical protein